MSLVLQAFRGKFLFSGCQKEPVECVPASSLAFPFMWRTNDFPDETMIPKDFEKNFSKFFFACLSAELRVDQAISRHKKLGKKASSSFLFPNLNKVLTPDECERAALIVFEHSVSHPQASNETDHHHPLERMAMNLLLARPDGALLSHPLVVEILEEFHRGQRPIPDDVTYQEVVGIYQANRRAENLQATWPTSATSLRKKPRM